MTIEYMKDISKTRGCGKTHRHGRLDKGRNVSFGGAHRSRVYVRVFIGVSVRACCERLYCTV